MKLKNYYWASSEARDGTQNPQLTSGGYSRDWLNSYPYLKFNLVGGDQFSCNWTHNSWKTAMQSFYRTAGNTFVTQYEFRNLLEQKFKERIRTKRKQNQWLMWIPIEVARRNIQKKQRIIRFWG